MSMSDKSNDGKDEHRDKRARRVRKGTRSCWECKRRKIRCIFANESDSTCKGCMDRGTSCISQEFVDDTERSNSNNVGLGHRLGRVEELLEKLMTKVSSSSENYALADEAERLSSTQGALGSDVFTPTQPPCAEYGNAPIMSLFDNSLFTRPPHQHQPRQMLTPDSTASVSSAGSSPKLENLRRTLSRLLPSQADCDTILVPSRGWWFVRKYIHPGFVLDDTNPTTSFSVDLVRTCHPTLIARLLLVLCLCNQQLPEGFDHKRLDMTTAPNLWMEKCMSTVATLVTSDDEIIGTVEGLECLVLTGIYQINLGNLRRAWVNFRRALSVAQLMGLHRFPIHRAKHSNSDSSCPEAIHRSYVYFQIVKGDIYLTLILGLPSAVSKDPFAAQPQDAYTALSTEESYSKHLCMIGLRIIERNSTVETHAYAETQQIDEELELLKRSMPSQWWALPTDLEFKNETLFTVGREMDRMLCHLWHYQIEALLHLPFMLRSATERRYEYSKISCLNASRELIQRWMVLRFDDTFVCHIVDFQAFMAAIIILLGLMGPMSEATQHSGQREEDRRLVDKLVKRLEYLSVESHDALAAQCAEVLRTLIRTDLNKYTGNLRLTIPYFGVLTLVSMFNAPDADKIAQDVTPIQSNDVSPRPQIWQGMSEMDQNTVPQPVLSFASSQFPALDELGINNATDWQFGDADIRVFDSLFNTDIEGNWGFGKP